MQVRLLVVDDEETIRMACEEYFSLLGHSVSLASTVCQAIRLLRSQPFDALLADLRLGGFGNEDGLCIIREGKAVNGDMRIALMSAHLSPEYKEAAYARGAETVFHKPVALAEVAAFLSSSGRDQAAN